jgi:hypothetical protein
MKAETAGQTPFVLLPTSRVDADSIASGAQGIYHILHFAALQSCLLQGIHSPRRFMAADECLALKCAQ